MNSRFSATLAALIVAGGAHAEVVESQAWGFTVRVTRVIAAPPAKVWATLVRPALWWSSDHTFSHDAANLTLDPVAGGAWLERLPSGGGVRHLTVVDVDPPSALRLEGALGPMQAMGAAGHLTFALKAQGESTLLTQTYDVGGHAPGPGGLGALSTVVDGVLGEQADRLKACAETGKTP
jgi:uncharacterized protein YndB with AHSA1/START domain